MVDSKQVVGVEDQQTSVLDVAASPVLAPEPSPAPPSDPLRELRLGLVCYGGVSLAIYMHGVTKELEKVVAASVAYERDQTSHSFAETDTAAMYWSLLKRLEDDTKVRTRVVVDVVSGTSAGGINGVFLAAAIARNRSQDPLRTMWMEKGDIRQLLTGLRLRWLWLKVPRVMLSVVGRRPLLDGNRISEWLQDALKEMGDDKAPIVSGVDSLLGPQERLQLFVPITDFFGYDVQIPADDPAWVSDRTHRHIMQFIQDSRAGDMFDQLSPRWDDALAFSARASSSFPGAFPPLSIADYEGAVKASTFDDGQRRALFAAYATSAGASPDKTHFVDGGVLDNKPFATTVAAIKLRPAANEVDRRLIYVEPDPTTEPGGVPDGKAPGLVKTIIGGYAGIPRQEPIIGDLTELAVHNTNVAKIRDVIETSFEPIRQRVGAHIRDERHDPKHPPSVEQLTRWRRALEEQVPSDSGFSYPTYLRLRIRSVVDNFAKMIAERRGYPLTSAHALFVGEALREWATTQHLLEQTTSATDEQRRLVDTLDLTHRERHVRFLIAALNWWYNPPERDGEEVPSRTALDQAKHILYKRLDQLNRLALLLTDNDQIRTVVDGLFGLTVITDALDAPIAEFVTQHAAQLTEVQRLVGETIGTELASVSVGLDQDIVGLTGTWPAWARTELLTRHVGFALWDVITYPIEAVSGVNERDNVEVMRFSPHESTTLATPAEKELKGVTLGHFGAFFSRAGRENDYLWGRLDAMERLIVLLSTPPGGSVGWARHAPNGDRAHADRLRQCDADCKAAAQLIVASEENQLTQIKPRLDFVKTRASIQVSV